jgi:hypothetical protein
VTLAPPAGAELTQADRLLFEATAQKGAAHDVVDAAAREALGARKRGDYEVLDYLITLRDRRLIGLFSETRSGSTPPEIEDRVLKNFDDREIATILISSLHDYRNPRLFEKLYGDVSALSQWRARRRRECAAVVWQVSGLTPLGAVLSPRSPYAPPLPILAQPREPQPAPPKATPSVPPGNHSYILAQSFGPRYEPLPGQPAALRGGLPGEVSGVGWAYKCQHAGEDDPATDLDGRPKDAFRTREDASVAVIASTHLPDVERRLAPLFRDISLLPAADWMHFSSRPARLTFRVTWPMPLSWSYLFMERGAGPSWRDISILLDQVQILPLSPGEPGDAGWSTVRMLLTLGTLTGDRAATNATVRWIERARMDARAASDGTVGMLIALLGPIVPEAQVDLSDLKMRIQSPASHERAVGSYDPFDRVEEENRSLREPTAVSLSRWLPRLEAPRLIPYLLAKGADPNGSVAHSGYDPPLVVGATNPAMVALLLDHGADVNQGRGGAQTALQAACTNPESLELMLKRGADVNVRAYGGSTALHRAAIGCAECVRMLLAAGAVVDAVDTQGRTPLHNAVRVDTAKLLLDAGADPNAEDITGESPYSLAANKDATDPLRLALEATGGRLSAAQLARRDALMKRYFK